MSGAAGGREAEPGGDRGRDAANEGPRDLGGGGQAGDGSLGLGLRSLRSWRTPGRGRRRRRAACVEEPAEAVAGLRWGHRRAAGPLPVPQSRRALGTDVWVAQD